MGYKDYSIAMAIMQGDLYKLLTMIGSGEAISYTMLFIDESNVSHGVEFAPSNMTFIESAS